MVHRRFPTLDFGTTAPRLLALRRATVLHVAAEFGNLDAVRLLLDHSADVNGKAIIEAAMKSAEGVALEESNE